ncbi:hypothetical protein AKO1_006081 [Acrasis kona]|uniref:Uncharacterized protein n=1 Tax=Acrasis kona TaxID=1008807 RepID=A0AAW2YIL0_9EUKA
MTSTPHPYKEVFDDCRPHVVIVDDELEETSNILQQLERPVKHNVDNAVKRLSWKQTDENISPMLYNTTRHKSSEFVDSSTFADFVSNSITPLSLTNTPHLSQQEACLKKYERVCLPLLDSRRKVVYVWCEEDQNALLREGILREKKYRSQCNADHSCCEPPGNQLSRSCTLSSLAPVVETTDHVQRRSSCGTIQEHTQVNNNRRHSISCLPSRPQAMQFSDRAQQHVKTTDYDGLFCTDSTSYIPSPFKRNPTDKPPKNKRLREHDEVTDCDEKVLVFDGIVRRKKGNTKPQDSFQIKFKLV